MPRVQFDDASLEVQDEGSGPPVLLLHGFPTTHLLWEGVIPGLVAAGLRVVAPDLVGYGASEPAPGVSVGMAQQARWMLKLIDALALERPLLVAHDVGSAAAQILVARAPGRFSGFVEVDGVYADNWAMDAVASIQRWEPVAAARLFPVLLRTLRAKGSAARVPEATLRRVLGAYEGNAGGRRLIRAARDLDPTETATIQDELRRRRVRSLVIWGAEDRYLPVEEVARPVAALLGAELRLLPGGHFLPLEAPEAVTREILGFLDAPPRGPPAPD